LPSVPVSASCKAARAALGLLERRLDAGYASATDVGTVRLRVAESQAGLAAARTEVELATGGLAEALAIPIDSLRRLELSFAPLDMLPASPAGSGGDSDRGAGSIGGAG
jgi:outer membrane protein TolC